uniref:UPAR/Ly6 domain-containing protein n=1 Tax=Xenopus tropicalis TaxID=8364 RepID=A0A1B8XXX5_XENTR
MRSDVGLLCALAALVSNAYSLSCTLCMIEGSINCEGETVECPQGLICSTSATEVTSSDGLTTYNIRKYCGDAGRCDSTAHFSYTNYKSLEVITCCNTENCTAPDVAWPKDNREPNGLSCPTCAYSGYHCRAKSNIKCVGKEEKCFTQTHNHQGLWESTIQTFRGCGTESHCKFGNWSMSHQGFRIDSDITCTIPNSNGAHSMSFLLIGHCLVLINIYLGYK